MKSFMAKHAGKINGVLECFDRVILLGHLPMASVGYFLTWMSSKRIALNLKTPRQGWWNFKDAAPWFAEQVKGQAQALAAQAGRPYRHLPAHEPMEKNARALAEQDGIAEGLVCVYSTLETCRTFRIRYGEEGPELGPDLRMCLVLYYYHMDREFGLRHVKIQTWFPFTVQVYVNGHEWLARKLARQGIAFEKVDNAFVSLADAAQASHSARGFCRRAWPKLLDAWARPVNPLLSSWLAGQNYYWVINQAEFSTDVLFAERTALATLRPRLYEHAALCFSAPQVMTFLGASIARPFKAK